MIRGAYSLTIALPKGRNFEEAVSVLRKAGLEVPTLQDERVMTLGQQGGTGILLLRNADVPVYVDLGIADAGVVGKDVLLESGRDVYEPVDLGTGICRISLIRHPDSTGPIRRVATKYPSFTSRLFKERGWALDIVELSGNVELAAVTGLADAVVDVVQTGATLKQAGLEEVEVLAHSSTRLIVNRQALKLKSQILRPLITKLRELSGKI
ncbi:MAG: ATP phosphoribosyltransferase [Deinococcus sp.]|nr:ATP phosphoribosyltransferase [Deinococcus sp.]MCL5964979.1 ATP phosphoribosyltransferase [Deinococcus sp.]